MVFIHIRDHQKAMKNTQGQNQKNMHYKQLLHMTAGRRTAFPAFVIRRSRDGVSSPAPKKAHVFNVFYGEIQ